MVAVWWVRADPRLAPSERETSLQSNAPSHWLGANLESTLVSICVKSQNQGSVHSGWRLGSVLLTGPWLSWFQQACLSTGPWMTWFRQACFVFNTGEFRQVPDFWNSEYTSSTTPGDLSPLAPGNPTLWRGVPVASIQKAFGSSGRDWKPWEKLQIPCKFCTYRFIRYSSTCYGKVRINPRMANIRIPDFFASPVANAAWFVVVRPCYLYRDLLSGPKGN